jgi:hypothetical protein
VSAAERLGHTSTSFEVYRERRNDQRVGQPPRKTSRRRSSKRWGTFEFLLEQAFDGVITAPHDEVVARYLSGGYWEELDEQQDGD